MKVNIVVVVLKNKSDKARELLRAGWLGFLDQNKKKVTFE